MENQLAKFDELKGKVAVFLEPLKGIMVRDKSENAAAKGALTTVKAMRSEVEELRVAAVTPYNDAVKRINEYAKQLSAPIIDAETDIKTKMAKFAADEQKRVDEEKRKIEQELEAKRREQEQERKRQQEMADRKAAEERRRMEIELKAKREAEEKAEKERIEALKAFGVDEDAEAEASRKADIASREEQERKAMEEKQEQERIALQAKLERDAAEVELEAARKARMAAASRPKNTRTVRKFEIIDRSLVPDEYWEINESLIGTDVRGGKAEIPGVRIYEEQVIVSGR